MSGDVIGYGQENKRVEGDGQVGVARSLGHQQIAGLHFLRHVCF